jgi:uncharacterized membrane protein
MRIEEVILEVMDYMIFFSQILATLVITVGMLRGFKTFVKDAIFDKGSSKEAMVESRIELGYSFSLGLGFLIGASILKTTAAPTWDDIGKLTAIIAIRTVLNYFMTKELVLLKGSSNSGKKNQKVKESESEIELF